MKIINKVKEPKALILIPPKLNNIVDLVKNYTMFFDEKIRQSIVFVEVFMPEKGVLKKDIFEKEWEEVKEYASTYDINIIAVAIPDYLTKIYQSKKKVSIEREIGNAKQIENFWVTPVLNYLAVRVSPNKKHLLDKSLMTLELLCQNRYTKSEISLDEYSIKVITSFDEAHKAFKAVINEPYLALDIETTGLKWYEDELISVAFATSDTAFTIMLHPKFTDETKKMFKLVKAFVEKYQGRFILHNASFDIPFLVYNLFMEHITDTENMVKGVNTFKLDDTMIMAYLCLNDYDRPKLGLKDLAYAKFGNWDNDIEQKNLLDYLKEEIGKYNAIDVLATFYLFNYFKDRLIKEEQDELYYNFYRRLLPAIIKMKMNGLTINKKGFEQLNIELENVYIANIEALKNTEYVKEAVALLKEEAKAKGKRLKEIESITFNPKSTNHLRKLLFSVMGLSVVKVSKRTGEPSTDKEVIQELVNNSIEGTEEYNILKAIQEIGEMKTVKSTFVEGFLQKGVETKEGFKLFPDFKITGTLSGRMAGGGGINFLNIPSGSKYGKLIKKNIIPKDNFVILQADADQLEDRLITATTGCKNKAKIFKHNLDAHANNAYAYWEDKMPDIKEALNKAEKATSFYILTNDECVTNLDSFETKDIKQEISKEDYKVKIINSVKHKYPELRQESKTYTFKMAYGGITDFSEQYEKLYQEVFDFVAQTEQELMNKGWVKGFYGLKARCNLTNILDKNTKGSALRSLFNMRTQSGALIISNAIFLLQEWIEEQGYETKVKITNSVYDSIYIECIADPVIIQKTANKLVEFMSPDYHKLAPQIPDEECYIPLGAEAEIGKSWIAEETLSNNCDITEVKEKLTKILTKGE